MKLLVTAGILFVTVCSCADSGNSTHSDMSDTEEIHRQASLNRSEPFQSQLPVIQSIRLLLKLSEP
jgi:hypothetical protein